MPQVPLSKLLAGERFKPNGGALCELIKPPKGQYNTDRMSWIQVVGAKNSRARYLNTEVVTVTDELYAEIQERERAKS